VLAWRAGENRMTSDDLNIALARLSAINEKGELNLEAQDQLIESIAAVHRWLIKTPDITPDQAASLRQLAAGYKPELEERLRALAKSAQTVASVVSGLEAWTLDHARVLDTQAQVLDVLASSARVAAAMQRVCDEIDRRVRAG
jgi:hypothetical protein